MGVFSDRIYAARVSRRISLREVAKNVGISAMYLSELENGVKIPDRSKVLPKLADYYAIPIDTLLNLAEEEKKDIAVKAAQEGDFKKAFAAARKNENISKTLSDLFKKGEIG